MFRSLHSLRFKVPAIFLAGVVVAGLVATALAVRLFQPYTVDRTKEQLRREARGIVALYGQLAGINEFPPNKTVESATGDLVFYVERVPDIGPAGLGLRKLPLDTLDVGEVERRGVTTLTVHSPKYGKLLAAAAPL